MAGQNVRSAIEGYYKTQLGDGPKKKTKKVKRKKKAAPPAKKKTKRKVKRKKAAPKKKMKVRVQGNKLGKDPAKAPLSRKGKKGVAKESYDKQMLDYMGGK